MEGVLYHSLTSILRLNLVPLSDVSETRDSIADVAVMTVLHTLYTLLLTVTLHV